MSSDLYEDESVEAEDDSGYDLEAAGMQGGLAGEAL
jgi:hypothetical protein